MDVGEGRLIMPYLRASAASSFIFFGASLAFSSPFLSFHPYSGTSINRFLQSLNMNSDGEPFSPVNGCILSSLTLKYSPTLLIPVNTSLLDLMQEILCSQYSSLMLHSLPSFSRVLPQHSGGSRV